MTTPHQLKGNPKIQVSKDKSGHVEKVLISYDNLKHNEHITSKVIQDMKLTVEITPMDEIQEESFRRLFSDPSE